MKKRIPHRMTLRLTPSAAKSLLQLCTQLHRRPTELINHLLDRTHAELEIMKGALDLFIDSDAENPRRALPKGDIAAARLLSRLLESTSWMPDDIQLRHDL